MAVEDDDEWPELPQDPEAIARRRKASEEMRAARAKAYRWAYMILGFLLAVVIYLAATR